MIIEMPDMALKAPRLPEEENIIPMSGEAAQELDIVLTDQRKHSYCPGFHRRVIVDDHRRMLICQDCKKAVDPFDYIKQWAQEGDQKNRALINITAKTKVAHAQFTLLEKRIDSIRGQLKRLGQPQPEKERSDYRHDLLNAEHPPFRQTPSPTEP